jgi:hypothetical protein
VYIKLPVICHPGIRNFHLIRNIKEKLPSLKNYTKIIGSAHIVTCHAVIHPLPLAALHVIFVGAGAITIEISRICHRIIVHVSQMFHPSIPHII